MCGIIGYVGKRDSVPLILDSLRRLEYRGYDSAGIAVIDASGALAGSKSEGKLGRLAERLGYEPLHGTTGLGHTRWATHGRPSDANAHPHLDCAGKIAVIHNGIIENYSALRERLIAAGHVFRSETDTEVIAHLIEANDEGDLVEALRRTLRQVDGAYALGVISQDSPERLVFARSGASPLVVGIGEGEMFVASDSPAILQYTRKQVILREGEMVVIERDGYELTDFDGKPIEREITQVMWDASSAEKDGFKHFMLKEMFVQPNVVKETLAGRIDESGDVAARRRDEDRRVLTWSDDEDLDHRLRHGVPRRHGRDVPAARALQAAGRDGTGQRVPLRRPPARPRTLTIAMSQSGETADTIEAVKIAKAAKAPVLGICNVLGSHLTPLGRRRALHARRSRNRRRGDQDVRFADGRDGALRALSRARSREPAALAAARDRARTRSCCRPRSTSASILPTTSGAPRASCARPAARCSSAVTSISRPRSKARSNSRRSRTFTPRATPRANSSTGRSRCSDSPRAGRRHRDRGPRAREDAVQPRRSEGARSDQVVVANHGDDEAAALADYVFWVPKVDELLSPIVNVVPLQLLAYHIADIEGKDVDQPRNLAKTVTVE